MMSLPLTEWISGALSRSESARNSSAAPWQPAPHMIRTLPAASIRLAIRATSSALAAISGRGRRVATLATPPLVRRHDDVLRHCQMGDAAAGIGRGDRLMDDGGRLLRRRDGFGVERDIAKQQIGIGGLDVIDALHFARHVAGERENGRMVARRFVKAGDQMGAAGPRGAGADAEPAGELGLAGAARAAPSSWRTPIHSMLASHGIGQRIERIADQSENLLDADALERADQGVRDCLSHASLTCPPSHRAGPRDRRHGSFNRSFVKIHPRGTIFSTCWASCLEPGPNAGAPFPFPWERARFCLIAFSREAAT